MRTRQRKVERRRLRRQKKRREQRVLALHSEHRLASDVHPLHACMVNQSWREDGKASILMARRVGTGCVTMAAFLVDLWAMGLKDAWGRTNIAISEFDEQISSFHEHLETCPLNLGTARHLVYGGINLARELGFRLPRRYERWTAILGPLPDGESPDMSLFLHEGKIMLVCSTRDLEARLIGTTPEKFLKRPDVHHMVGDDDFTLVDEEEDSCDDFLTQLGSAMVDRVRQWCFANGQTPHPLLPVVVGAAFEAMVQGLPPDLDPDEEIDSLSDEQRDEVAAQTASFVSASFHHDPAALETAMAQVHGFMSSMSSPQEFFEALEIPDD